MKLKHNQAGGYEVGPGFGRAQPRGTLMLQVPNDYARIRFVPPDSIYANVVYVERDPAFVAWAERQLWGETS